MGARCGFALRYYAAALIKNTVVARSISQIQSDRPSFLFPNPVCRSGGKLFHCRSPLSLVPQSTSIIWERTASRRRPAFSSHLFTTVDRSYHILLRYALGKQRVAQWKHGFGKSES